MSEDSRRDTTLLPPPMPGTEPHDIGSPPMRRPDWIDTVLEDYAELAAKKCGVHLHQYRRELFAPDGRIAKLGDDVARLLNAEERRIAREEANWELIKAQMHSIGTELATLRREMGQNKKRTDSRIDRLSSRVEAIERELTELKRRANDEWTK